MTCSRCRSNYDTLACPVCIANASRQAYLAQQKMFLPSVLDGRLDLRFAKRKVSEKWHVQLIEEPTHAFCGEPLNPPLRRQRSRYAEKLRKDTCERCLAQFDSLVSKLGRDHVPDRT